MADARVWNDHSKEHVEEFRGEKVKIPAGGFVEMSWPDAVQFRGQHTPVIRDGLGNDLHPKKIRVEKIEAKLPPPEGIKKFVCQMDGAEFTSQEALDDHIAENHADAMLDDDAKKKAVERKARKAT